MAGMGVALQQLLGMGQNMGAQVPQMPQPQMQQQPQQQQQGNGVSRGQMIAGILADMLSAAGGRQPQFAPMMQRQQEREDERAEWGRRLEMQKAQQAPYRWEANDGSLMEMGPGGQPRVAYRDPTPKTNPDAEVFVTLPNGSFYAGPKSGLAAALTGGMPQQPSGPVGKLTPVNGGPTPQASGGFPRRY